MAANSDQKESFWKAATLSLGTYKVICSFCNPECSETLIFDGSVWNKMILLSFLQEENKYPISVTELGMVTLVSSSHQKNTLTPILFTDLGMVILFNLLHASNAQFPISVTESGITVLAHPCIRRFVLVSMMALQLFRESYTLFSSATIILVSPKHPRNTALSIFVTDSGMLTFVSVSHQLNALSSISVTELGMVMLVSALHSCIFKSLYINHLHPKR